MVRSPLYGENYKPSFSGHQTFPLRYGWLKKAVDAVENFRPNDDNKIIFTGDDAIARFGVGKNMVASIRHWAIAANVIEPTPDGKSIKTTEFGRLIFNNDGLDCYMQAPSTLWLLHWHLSGSPEKTTTWFWAFSHFPAQSFQRIDFLQRLKEFIRELNWRRVSETTLKRDISCFLRTYATTLPISGRSHLEDLLDSPLTELGLVKSDGNRDGFRFVRGPKPSLNAYVVCYAITDFWNRQNANANTLSLEALVQNPGSPGRTFLLDENSIVEFLERQETLTDGIYRWSETAGLKMLIRERELSRNESLRLVAKLYSGNPA